MSETIFQREPPDPSGTGLVSAAPRLNTEIHKSEHVTLGLKKRKRKKKPPVCKGEARGEVGQRKKEREELASGLVSDPSGTVISTPDSHQLNFAQDSNHPSCFPFLSDLSTKIDPGRGILMVGESLRTAQKHRGFYQPSRSRHRVTVDPQLEGSEEGNYFRERYFWKFWLKRCMKII